MFTRVWKNYLLKQFQFCKSNRNTKHRFFTRGNVKGQEMRIFLGGTSNIHIFAPLLGYFAYKLYEEKYSVLAQTPEVVTDKPHAQIPSQPSLPIYSMNEVSKHNNRESRIWVTFQNGVYDITEFVNEHPGGEQILMAAGSAVDPFWMLYSVHLNAHVMTILEKYRIGNLDPKENNDFVGDMSDPYANEPKRHQILRAASQKPFNAESPENLLVDNFITPNELFYVRNHLPVPDIDPNTYNLEIEIEGRSQTVSFSLEDIKNFPKHTITATIMCAGNRRSEMTKVKPVKGLSWGGAAVGNATWSGARLKDVLLKAGLTEDEVNKFEHIQFEAFDTDATGASYGASIPIWKAMDKRGEVILAYEMNGSPLPRDHGFPIRAVVPGVVGARNVKWLGKVIVSSEESQSHWQQSDYKGFSPSTDWDTVDYSKSPSIQELPVTSFICQPAAGSKIKTTDGHFEVRGYAWSGGGQAIVRVDVTCDGGKTWHVANFDHHGSENPPQHWSWTLWSCQLPVSKDAKDVEIWVKAIDSSYNTQPESFENVWNLRGVLGNAYHKINVTLE